MSVASLTEWVAIRQRVLMATPEQDEIEELLSPWEQTTSELLDEQSLPRWDHKAKAATFAQGHRGLLDLELDFPTEYLKGEALVCYVWKRALGDGLRVHSYVDVDGRCFHVEWEDETDSGPQQQPVHVVGLCTVECSTCEAVALVHRALSSRAAE